MNGADVKGIPDDRVQTLCSPNDGVCKGEFNIGAGHFSYMSDGSVSKAAAFVKQWMQ